MTRKSGRAGRSRTPAARHPRPDRAGKELLFAFFAAMAETERENVRESTLEGLDTAALKGKHGGRPPVITVIPVIPVITDDMLHAVLRRRTGGESVEQAHTDFAALQAGDVPRPRPKAAALSS